MILAGSPMSSHVGMLMANLGVLAFAIFVNNSSRNMYDRKTEPLHATRTPYKERGRVREEETERGEE